jgi:carbon storage regulator
MILPCTEEDAMLVLSRRPKEIIKIADNIVVEVLVINDGEVKLGIVAPRNVAVMRGELKGPCKKVEGIDVQK